MKKIFVAIVATSWSGDWTQEEKEVLGIITLEQLQKLLQEKVPLVIKNPNDGIYEQTYIPSDALNEVVQTKSAIYSYEYIADYPNQNWDLTPDGRIRSKAEKYQILCAKSGNTFGTQNMGFSTLKQALLKAQKEETK